MIAVSRRLRRLNSEAGAETLEFALVAPVLLFVLLGTIYALLVLSANVTLAHAASSAVRYASVPTDNIDPEYPSQEQVLARLFDATPFFSADQCAASVAGDARPNAPVTLSVTCPFANPLGTVLNGLGGLFQGGGGAPFGDSFEISATAVARRE